MGTASAWPLTYILRQCLKPDSKHFYGHLDPKKARSETSIVDITANSYSFVEVTKKAILL